MVELREVPETVLLNECTDLLAPETAALWFPDACPELGRAVDTIPVLVPVPVPVPVEGRRTEEYPKLLPVEPLVTVLLAADEELLCELLAIPVLLGAGVLELVRLPDDVYAELRGLPDDVLPENPVALLCPK